MKRWWRFAAVAAALLIFTGSECPPLVDDQGGVVPDGPTFALNPGIVAVAITGDPRLSDRGPFTLAFTASASGGTELRDTLPAGLLFRSRRNATQHMILLKDHPITAGTSATVNLLGSFCGNLRRVSPDRGDTFDIGPVAANLQTQHRDGLVQLVGLVRGKDISGPDAMWMVQRAVYLVTDSTGLTQAYIDSINALPPEGGPLCRLPQLRSGPPAAQTKAALRRNWGF